MRVHLSLLLLAACASPLEPPPAQPEAAAAPPSSLPLPPLVTRSCTQGSGRDFTASEHGIRVDTLEPPAWQLTAAPARHLRLSGERLYFFDTQRPVLRSVAVARNLHPSAVPLPARLELELPPLEHPGFASADPLAYLQRQEDLDIQDNILCLDVHDRPGAPTLTYNHRIDLATLHVERRLVEDLTGDRCGQEREAVRPRLCTPAGPSAADSKDGTCVRVDIHPVVPLAPTAP